MLEFTKTTKCTECGNDALLFKRIPISGQMKSWHCDTCGAICNYGSMEVDVSVRRIYELEKRIASVERIIGEVPELTIAAITENRKELQRGEK